MTQQPPPPPHEGPDDLSPPPTPEEQAEAEALARALEGHARHPELALVEALRAAHDPAPLDPRRHEELLVRALADASERGGGRVLSFPGRRWAVLAAVAAAACLLLVLGRSLRRPSVPLALAASRSTQALFPEQFPRQGGGSARVDRIQVARARDLRENRFAQWGVP